MQPQIVLKSRNQYQTNMSNSNNQDISNDGSIVHTNIRDGAPKATISRNNVQSVAAVGIIAKTLTSSTSTSSTSSTSSSPSTSSTSSSSSSSSAILSTASPPYADVVKRPSASASIMKTPSLLSRHRQTQQTKSLVTKAAPRRPSTQVAGSSKRRVIRNDSDDEYIKTKASKRRVIRNDSDDECIKTKASKRRDDGKVDDHVEEDDNETDEEEKIRLKKRHLLNTYPRMMFSRTNNKYNPRFLYGKEFNKAEFPILMTDNRVFDRFAKWVLAATHDQFTKLPLDTTVQVDHMHGLPGYHLYGHSRDGMFRCLCSMSTNLMFGHLEGIIAANSNPCSEGTAGVTSPYDISDIKNTTFLDDLTDMLTETIPALKKDWKEAATAQMAHVEENEYRLRIDLFRLQNNTASAANCNFLAASAAIAEASVSAAATAAPKICIDANIPSPAALWQRKCQLKKRAAEAAEATKAYESQTFLNRNLRRTKNMKTKDLKKHDVVCRKGRGDHERWPGNKLYRRLINATKDTYNYLAHIERCAIISLIIDTIIEKDGWFVSYSESTGKWAKLTEEEVRNKVSISLHTSPAAAKLLVGMASGTQHDNDEEDDDVERIWSEIRMDVAATNAEGREYGQNRKYTSRHDNDNVDQQQQVEQVDVTVTTLPIGVTRRHSDRWQAQIYYAGKTRYIGVWDTLDHAANAYLLAKNAINEQQKKKLKQLQLQVNELQKKKLKKLQLQVNNHNQQQQQQQQQKVKAASNSSNSINRNENDDKSNNNNSKSDEIKIKIDREWISIRSEIRASVSRASKNKNKRNSGSNNDNNNDNDNDSYDDDDDDNDDNVLNQKPKTKGYRKTRAGTFEAQIVFKGRSRNIGTFKDERDAASAFKVAKRKVEALPPNSCSMKSPSPRTTTATQQEFSVSTTTPSSSTPYLSMNANSEEEEADRLKNDDECADTSQPPNKNESPKPSPAERLGRKRAAADTSQPPNKNESPKPSPAERLGRKRAAARLRQQRCRDRKRQAMLDKKRGEVDVVRQLQQPTHTHDLPTRMNIPASSANSVMHVPTLPPHHRSHTYPKKKMTRMKSI